MIALKGRLLFRQYMPAKPTKYSTKVWMAADAANGYMANFSVYLWREGNEGHANGLGYDAVIDMACPFLHKPQHIYFDNFFTGTIIIDYLLAQDTNACETVHSKERACHHVQTKSSNKERWCRCNMVTCSSYKYLANCTNTICATPKEQPRNYILIADTYTVNIGEEDHADQLLSTIVCADSGIDTLLGFSSTYLCVVLLCFLLLILGHPLMLKHRLCILLEELVHGEKQATGKRDKLDSPTQWPLID